MKLKLQRGHYSANKMTLTDDEGQIRVVGDQDMLAVATYLGLFLQAVAEGNEKGHANRLITQKDDKLVMKIECNARRLRITTPKGRVVVRHISTALRLQRKIYAFLEN